MRLMGGRLVVVLAILLVVMAILEGLNVVSPTLLVFAWPGANEKPWTALTYPFVGGLVIAFINALGLVSIGSSVERDIGSAKTGVMLLVVTLLGALGTQIGSMILDRPAFLGSSWLWVSAVIVAFGTRYPRQQVLLMGIAAVEARWLAWGSLVLDLAAVVPMAVAPFTLISMAFVWAFAANKLPFFPYGKPLSTVHRPAPTGRGVKPPREGYFDDVKRREKEREERERLRKLFEGSISDPKDDK